MPTEHGTVLHAGRRPSQDAMAVALLRRAGAVIMGKTVTTELAVYTPGKTANPHDPRRTPGGSSSGSAAAVAAGMVPLALGSQTNGSVIRPASYCGVFGYKPSFGLISRRRALRQSRRLDHVGMFARSLEDLALMAEPLMAFDAGDRAMVPEWPPALRAGLAEPPPLAPRLGLIRTAAWEQGDADMRAGMAELAAVLGDDLVEVTLAPAFADAWRLHQTIMEADLAASFSREYAEGRDQLSPRLREMIERGAAVTPRAYRQAVAAADRLRQLLGEVFCQFDAIVTPATAGQAPPGLEATGSPAFCTTWTLLGVPALSLPLLAGADGLPIGVQLVGAVGDDARLMRTAQWLLGRIG